MTTFVPGTRVVINVNFCAGLPIKYMDKIRYDIIKLVENNQFSYRGRGA